MLLKPLQIGGVQTPNNLFLAPLAGYTNYPFRKLCSSFGAGLCFTEMVSAKGLKYGSENTKELLYTEPTEVAAAQIFGNDPLIMRGACEHEALAPFPIVDINMGCPVPKIYKNGEGSALLEDPLLAEKIVKECVKSGKTISVKFRVGVTDKKLVTEEFARRMAGAGASLLTIHGRTREMFYTGDLFYKEIEKAKKAVFVPVIANGGVFSVSDADRLIANTGADGVMIARAATFDPQIFADFTGKKRVSKLEAFSRQFSDTARIFDERFTTVFMRKMGVFYLKGQRGAAVFKQKFFACETPEQVLEVAKEAFAE